MPAEFSTMSADNLQSYRYKCGAVRSSLTFLGYCKRGLKILFVKTMEHLQSVTMECVIN